MNTQEAKENIKAILKKQNLGVLATVGDPYPYTSLIGFAHYEDLTKLYFATKKKTKKYENMKKDGHVSVLIDTQTNSPEDFDAAFALTALGVVEECSNDEKTMAEKMLTQKHPQLRGFVDDPLCAMICVHVDSYVLVTHLQDITHIQIR